MSIQPEEHDDLWDLLGKSKPSTLPPTFASTVVSSVETLQAAEQDAISLKPSGQKYLWGSLAASLAAAIIVLLNFAPHKTQPDMASDEEAQLIATLSSQHVGTGDLHLLTHLDELIDAELTSLWSDSL